MIQVDYDAYKAMFGNVDMHVCEAAARCVSQCAGCTCSCRCSCSGGIISDFEWEEI